MLVSFRRRPHMIASFVLCSHCSANASVMTGLELFPRGKGPSSAAPDGAGKGKARGSEAGKGGNAGKGQGDPKRKRKAAESSATASGGQKDWLFGAPQSNEAAPASGKKAREGGAAAGSSTSRGKAGHGKVRVVWCDFMRVLSLRPCMDGEQSEWVMAVR